MHVNRQIREAVAGRLVDRTSLVTVDANRGMDLLDADLPAGIISTGFDEIARWNKGTKDHGPEDLRRILLTVTLIADGTSTTLDDDLDGLRAEVEPEVYAALEGLAVEARHTGGEMDMLDEQGDRWFAFLVLSWEVDVATEITDPERALI